MRYGLSVIVLMAMLAMAMPALAASEVSGFWNIAEFCGAGPLCVGLKERIRQEVYNNLDVNDATNDSTNYFRTRSQLYAEWKISEFDTARIQLTNEFFNYLVTPTAGTEYLKNGNPREIFFDHTYVSSKEIMESPVSLTAGRFELLNQYGDNFIFADGTPQDGSRSMFFDALKASISIDDNNAIDLMYIDNDKKDKKMPRINKQDAQTINTSNDSGPAVIWKAKLSDELYLEPYYVWKNEEYSTTVESDLHTFGAFAKYKMDDMTLRAQFALQTGDYGTQDREGMGGYLFLDKPFKDMNLKPVCTLGALYLSGDDPSTTDKVEGWNPLYSRFPGWNEIYAYVLRGETGQNGYWTNTIMFTAKAKLKVNDKFSTELALDYFLAVEKQKTATSTAYGDGSTKGLSPNVTFSYAFSKTVTGRYQFLYFMPGDFYQAGTTDADNSFFTRVELALSF